LTTTSDGHALDVALDQPKSLYVTSVGNTDTLWIADMGNSQIRKIDIVLNGAPVAAADAMNIRVAGSNRSRPYGDGHEFNFNALEAELSHPEGVWVANDGTLYISDGGNNLIREVAPLAAGIRQ